MIIDNIINIDRYSCLLDISIIQTLKDIYYNSKTQSNINYNIFEYDYDNNIEDSILFENHLSHIDYQLLIEGNEYMYISDSDYCTKYLEYNNEDDYQLFTTTQFDKILLNKGDFIVFMENEIHSPKHYFNAKKVRRLVIKEEIKNE